MVESSTTGDQVYLVHFRKFLQHIDFCLQELEALASLCGVTDLDKLYVEGIKKAHEQNLDRNAAVFIRLPSEEVVKQIVGRSIMIKEIIDVFGHTELDALLEPPMSKQRLDESVDGTREGTKVMSADRYDKLIEAIDKDKILLVLAPRLKFKFAIEGVGRKIQIKEQIAIIEKFKVFPLHDEDVSLDKP